MSKYRSLNRTAKRRAFNNPVITDNTYAGELATPFLTPAVKAADTLAKGYVRQIDGIRNKAVLSVTSIQDNVIQAGGAGAACAFQDGDSVTLTESVLTLSDLKVNEKLCRAKILPTFMGQVGARNAQDWASPEFRNFVIATVAGKTAASVENLVWVGGAVGGAGFLSDSGTFNRAGLAAGALATGAGGTLGATISTITKDNVIAQMGIVYDSAATNRSALLSKPDFALYVNPKTAALYRQQLATAGGTSATLVGQGVNSQSTNQAIDNLNYLGVPILTCPGMPADCVIAAQRENLVVGSNLNTDYTSTQYIPFYQYDGSDNVGVTMRFGLGMQVGVAADVIVGTTAAILPA
jgi:hypothetical protein